MTTPNLPPRALQSLSCGAVDASEWPGLVAQLLVEGTPRLAVARLTGGTVALGRFQRTASTLTALGTSKPRTRRVTGGRTIALGDGMVAIALVLPHRAFLVGERPGDLPASRLLNRSVRGILGGLAHLGVPATYFGRDFVTANGGQAGFLGFDIDAQGRTVLECVLPVATHWWPDDAWLALPARTPVRGVPGPVMLPPGLPLDPMAWLDALARGFSERLGVTCVPANADAIPLPHPRPTIEDPPDLPHGSGWHETPGGFLEARADVREGRFVDATLCGELLVDSGALVSLRTALRGLPVNLDAIGPVLDATWSDAGHAALGLDDLGLAARALLLAGEGATT